MFTVTRRRRLNAAAALLAGLLVLTACGGSDDSSDRNDNTNSSDSKGGDVSDQSTDELINTAREQLRNADVFTLSGEVTEDDSPLGVSLSFVGDDVTGSITIGGDTLDLLAVDGVPYIRASSDFWTNQAGDDGAIASLLADKWITAADDFEDFAELTDRDSFVTDLISPDGDVSRGEDKTVNGVDCIALVDEEDGGILYLDKRDGRPISITSPDGAGGADFSYDSVDAPTKPADDEIVDTSQLGS